MRLIPTRLALAATAASCVALGLAGPLDSASAAPVTQITHIAPSSGPEFSSIPVVIHGSNFNTEPGGTTVSFGGEPALSVSCKSKKVCTAMSPELPEGPVEVTATSHEMTSTASITFTYERYSPPLVKITNQGFPAFNAHKITDRYAGIFDPGNVYLQIENTYPESVVIDGPTGEIDLNEGETAGYNIPVQSAPYTFELQKARFGAKQKLTVKTKTPR